jgi:NDP-sugar pyrophosphorylase family protein
MRAVILAGGKGTRLSPYTSVFPKPLMPIGGFPILHVVVSQLHEAGFDHITLAIGHMGDMIRTYFGNGCKFGVKIDYSLEDKPLGTIGALSLIKNLPENFLVMNGDILTDLNYAEFLAYHQSEGASATIATYNKELEIQYGVIEFNNKYDIVGFREKPTLDCHVSMGIYAFNASILKYINKDRYFDFPDLVKLLIMRGERIISCPLDVYWMDIGCHADYEKAAKDFEKMKKQFLQEPIPYQPERISAQGAQSL